MYIKCNGLDCVIEVCEWYYVELVYNRYLKFYLKWLKIKNMKIVKENNYVDIWLM